MQKTLFQDKYPVYSLEIPKNKTSYKNVDEIIEYFKSKIEAHPIAVFITVFDHYAHTKTIKDAVIMDGLQDAKNVLFCFGKQIPTTKVLAVRPRSIGISEFNDSFMIDFLEVPNEQLQLVLQEWVETLANAS